MHTDAPPAEYLTTAQAGQYLGFTERTMIEWRRTGRGPRYVRVGGPTSPVRYARSELDRYMRARMYESTAAESVARTA